MYMASKIIAVETPVTDYLYDASKADSALRDAFLYALKPARPPRKGDNILVSAEEWQEKLLAFARKRHLPVDARLSPEEQAVQVRDRIFGAPRAIEAGGAIANSFDTLVKSRVDDVSLTDGFFITAVGEGISGDVFSRSLPGKLKAPPARGRQMEGHIIPLDGDRIIVAVPSFLDPPSLHMSPSQLDDIEIDQETMLMLGGYMKYTGKYDDFLDALLSKTIAVSPWPQDRPTLVLTAAAQDIAASQTLKEALERCRQVTSTVVCANTGEFRRLMGMDTEWRRPHEARWWINDEGQTLAVHPSLAFMDPGTTEGIQQLDASGWKKIEGEDLERAKQADVAYMADKLKANEAAYRIAFEQFCENSQLPVTFVVTNGKRGVHVVSGHGVSDNYPAPRPPHGVVNTVGGGDGFAAGYLLGHAKKLSQEKCVELGFICAGEIIGRDEARLKAIAVNQNLDGKPVALEGLPACLNPENPRHMAILAQLRASVLPQSSEIERKFLVIGDAWKDAVQEVFLIQQNYVPSQDDNSIQLRIIESGGQVSVRASHPEKGDISTFHVPEEILEKFGRDNLQFIMDGDGTIPVGDRVEARIRFKDGHPVMTIKAKMESAVERYELEFPVSTEDADRLLPYCPERITKLRHRVLAHGTTWEVDVYQGALAGLVVAEIELPHIDTEFVRPGTWLGAEVTHDARYSNRLLARSPAPP